ncbi:PGF-pre-PGF domain-containing protein [Methanosarcina sp. MSH10X1]|uniref:PGF-pre-PGF domain-containing protein n=1 Tax=Methanosarcina sp. MSH10X1 TaxID=2507075 RepID=UPI000FFB160C|nr:PGF-pre-PGF domain-containing protein [Methanosarcina sp. MSH10X1]RXA21714.1 PGF-pre-PGF domain-containing protein [Methanosarcina sp. MSH10X1]
MTNKKKLYSIPLALLVLFFLIFGSSVALAGTETQLVHGQRLVEGTRIHGNIVTWYDNSGNSINVYDIAAGKQIDITGYTFGNIPVYGDKIVWSEGLNEKIMMYNLSTGEKTQIIPVDSGTDSPDSYGHSIEYLNPDIYEDKIVYVKSEYSNSSPTSRFYSLYLYDLVTHKETQIATSDYSIHCVVYGNKIVWSEKGDIYIYDIPTQRIGSISTSGAAGNPDIYNNIVIWGETHNEESSTYMRDIATHITTQINTSGGMYNRAFHGNRIVWESEYNVDGKWMSNIDMYDISTGKMTRITNSGTAHCPSIFEDKIVYADLRNDPEDREESSIYLYDLSSTVENSPTAEFTANVTSGNVPLVVLFDDTSTGGVPTSWLWDFGDGIDSKHAMNATHTFTKSGVYNVSLTVANEAGNSTVTKLNYITVTSPQTPVADFSANVTSGAAPLVVLFTDTSTERAPNTWYWDFGDGSSLSWYSGIDSKYSMNVTHTFTKPGNYTISLTAGNDVGDSTATKPGYIVVSDPNAPVANFSSNITEGYAPLTVQFYDLSQKAASWAWDFNSDGQPDSNDTSPVHIYANAGTYTVNLTVSNENGTASKNAAINVLTPSSSSGSSEGSSHKNSGGSGGGGGSPEPAKNVQAKEISQAHVANGKPIKFDFTKNATCVAYVSFDAKKTTGKTTTIAEQLKAKSTLTSNLSSGEVYKYFNLWVGNAGFATEKNIENPVVCFKVEKSWLEDKKIDQNSIALNRYNEKKWSQMPAKLLKEDERYLYFTAETPEFSSFAITGKAVEKETGNETEPATGVQDAGQESIAAGSKDGQKSETGKITSIPGFGMVCGIVCLIMVFLYKRK